MVNSGELRLANSAKTDWTANQGSLTVQTGATLNLWDSGIASTVASNSQVFIDALDGMYRSREVRERFSSLGLDLVKREEFRWHHIGARFAEELRQVV